MMNHSNHYSKTIPNRNNYPINQCERRDHLKQLQAIDFAIQETVLYLDAYPNCRQALEFYHHLIAQRKHLMESYEKEHGPLTMYGNTGHTSWDWIDGPWPWELDAN